LAFCTFLVDDISADFSIAKIAEEQVLKTQANSILGTPVYMAPEQCRGASAVTDKSDVYSLGVMMYEMLAGQPPFMGQGIGEIMAAHLMNEPPPLRDIQPSVSPDVAALVHRLLKKDQAQRPTMREVIAELERLGAARTGVLSAVQDTLPVRNQGAPPDARTIMGEASAGTPVAAPPAPTPNRTMAIGDANLPPITKGPVAASGGSQAPHHTAVLPSPAPSIAKQPLVIAGVLGGLLSIGMGVFLYNRKHAAQVQKEGKLPPKPITNQQPKNDPKRNTPKKPAARPPDPNAPEGMVRVGGGTLQQGSTSDGVDSAMKLCQRRGVSCRRELYERETPQREVTISDFYMDKTEVTNQDMVAWLNKQQGLKVEKGRFVRIKKVLLLDLFEEQSGITWTKKKDAPFKVREGDAKRPVSLVTWDGARRYCAGKYMRLPTEAEWEMAARGEEGRFYPWGGDTPQCPGVVFGRAATLPADRSCSTGERRPEPVGHAEQDQTPDGVSDLAGNVAEWVQDVFVEHYPACSGGCTDPVQTEPGASSAAEPGADSTSKKGKSSKKKSADASVMLRVVRGGSFSLPADACRGAGRSRRAEDQAKMDIGFRCAMAVKK
jgi:serine/threonine-protein kinase